MLAAIDNFALVWRPVIPPWAIALLALILAGLAVKGYAGRDPAGRRRWAKAVLLALRLASIGILAVILAGPSRQSAAAGPDEKPRLAVLVDVSGSMNVRDVKEKSREEVALDRAFRIVDAPAVARGFTTSLDGFAAGVTPLDPSQRAGGKSTETRLLDTVREQAGKMAGSPAGSAILVVSDGRDTGGGRVDPVAASAKASGLRIHTMTLGDAAPADGVWLRAEIDRETFLLHQPAEARVRVWSAKQRGVTVVAESDGQTVRVPVHLIAGVAVPVTIPLRTDAPGERRVALSLEGLSAGLAPRPRHVFYGVLPKRIKVLILAGEPDWDTKFIAQALRLDERIELVSATALMTGRAEVISTRSEVNTVPTTPREIASYDVIVVGAKPERVLNESGIASIVDYVAAGGHAVLLDEPAASWSSLDPVHRGDGVEDESAIRFARDAPPLLAGLPAASADAALSHMPVPAVRRATGLKPAARSILETTGGKPAVVAMDFGRGRAVAVLARDLWRWRMLPPDSGALSEVHDLLWSNLVRWLALGDGFEPGGAVKLELDARTLAPGRPLSVEVSARWRPSADFAPRMSVVNEQGDRVPVTMTRGESETRWNGTFTPRVEGEYRVVLDASPLRDAPIEKRFRAVAEDREEWNTSADPALMRDLSARTGGLVLDAAKIDEVPALLLDAQPRAGKTIRTEPAWDRWGVLALIAGLLGAEWLGRRWMGWP